MALRIQHHLFSPGFGQVWVARRALTGDQIGSHGGNYNPRDDDK
jgi:hypothetical protein